MTALTAAEDEALTIVEEECAELIQAIAKARRFGLDGVHPETGDRNRDAIEREAGDVVSAIELAAANCLNIAAIFDRCAAKHVQRRQWLRHAMQP